MRTDLKSLHDFGRAQERGESQIRHMNNGNSSNSNDLGHIYAVNTKKDGHVKAQQIFKKKTPQRLGKILLLSQRKVVFIVVVNTHILQLALHQVRLIGLARRVDILQVSLVRKVNQSKWWNKLY